MDLFENVIRADPVYVSPSEMRPRDLRGQSFSRPLQLLATLRLLTTSAERLIRRHVRARRAIRFFDKLTSTYCCTTMAETPAILAATMFVDNKSSLDESEVTLYLSSLEEPNLAAESTVMGTGTPAITVSGISAADVALRDRRMSEYRWHPGQRDVVTVVDGPVARRPAPTSAPGSAALCGWCEVASCRAACPAGIDIRGVLRRLEMENVEGARHRLAETGGRPLPCPSCQGRPCERACQRIRWAGAMVPIVDNLAWTDGRSLP